MSEISLHHFLDVAESIFPSTELSRALKQLAIGHAPSCIGSRHERCRREPCDPFEGIEDTVVVDLVNVTIPNLKKGYGSGDSFRGELDGVLVRCATRLANAYLELDALTAGETE